MSGKKDDIIGKPYNEFYGSIKNTLWDAQQIDPSTKYQDVKQCYEKQFIRKQI